MGKFKISRPILYMLVLGAVAYAVVLLTEPEAPRKKPSARTTQKASLAPPGFTEEDMTATFARYVGGEKDAFKPKVVAKKPAPVAAVTPPSLVTTGVWVLTGINSTNGRRSALLENPSTGDIVFLEVGDAWNGMRVSAIEPKAIVLVNSLGQVTRLEFVESLDDETPAGIAPVVLPGPASGSPASGSPASGSPASGSPASGSPASGSPASGNPARGAGRNPASGFIPPPIPVAGPL